MKRIDTSDLAARYLAGETKEDLAKSFGVSSPVILNRLKKLGVPLRSNSEVQRARFGSPAIDEDVAVNLYIAGTSEQAVAKYFGANRAAIRQILKSRGVQIRGRGDATSLRMRQATPEERLALTQAAHAAVRGVPQGEEQRRKIALGRERLRSGATPSELDLGSLLEEAARARGEAFPALGIVYQKAIGRYNADIALTGSSVAVEIFGGHWHTHGHHAEIYRKRLDHFLDSGWLPLIIWATKTFPLGPGAVDYVLSLHEARSQGESCGSQEHVIRGDGYRDSIIERDAVDRPRVPSYKPRDDTRGDDLGPR